MGACSTLRITAEAAKKYLVNRIMFSASVDELEDLTSLLLRERCFNAVIIDSDEEGENDDDVLRY